MRSDSQLPAAAAAGSGRPLKPPVLAGPSAVHVYLPTLNAGDLARLHSPGHGAAYLFLAYRDPAVDRLRAAVRLRGGQREGGRAERGDADHNRESLTHVVLPLCGLATGFDASPPLVVQATVHPGLSEGENRSGRLPGAPGTPGFPTPPAALSGKRPPVGAFLSALRRGRAGRDEGEADERVRRPGPDDRWIAAGRGLADDEKLSATLPVFRDLPGFATHRRPTHVSPVGVFFAIASSPRSSRGRMRCRLTSLGDTPDE